MGRKGSGLMADDDGDGDEHSSHRTGHHTFLFPHPTLFYFCISTLYTFIFILLVLRIN